MNGLGGSKPLKLVFRQQQVLAVVGEQHSLVADEQDAAVPLRNAAVAPDGRLVAALIPGQLERGRLRRAGRIDR